MDQISELHSRIGKMKSVKVEEFGSSLIVAPHPDDETLGCGGTVALMRKNGIPVHFLFVSDGSMSHPNSKKYPAKRLTKVREKEAKNAVLTLGGQVDHMEFLRLKDTKVPHEHDNQFEETVQKIVKIIDEIEPQSVFVPWQKDPHPDHQATWKIMSEAVNRAKIKPRFIEYPIWLWELGNPKDLELLDRMKKFTVNIEDTLGMKNKALAAHTSQVTHMIDDDPEGFMLTPQVIAHFDIPRELFFESAIK
ncbi:MAG: PIG-L deacetylase family protein [Dyadobacter sp.]